MTFRFLVATYAEKEKNVDGLAPLGEPVIPNFPTSAHTSFIGVRSGKPAPFAKIEVVDADPDEFVASLTAKFKGLPPSLHSAYVWKVLVEAARLPLGKTYTVSVATDESATLFEVGDIAHKPICLWPKRPLATST